MGDSGMHSDTHHRALGWLIATRYHANLSPPKSETPGEFDCPGVLDLVLRALDNQRGHISC